MLCGRNRVLECVPLVVGEGALLAVTVDLTDLLEGRTTTVDEVGPGQAFDTLWRLQEIAGQLS